MPTRSHSKLWPVMLVKTHHFSLVRSEMEPAHIAAMAWAYVGKLRRQKVFSSSYPRRDWTPPMKCPAALIDLCLQWYMHYEQRILQMQCSSVVQSINVLLCEYVLHVVIAYAIRFIRCRCPGTFAASGGAVAVGWQEDKIGFTVCCNCSVIRNLCDLMHVQWCDIRCPHMYVIIYYDYHYIIYNHIWLHIFMFI